MAVGRCGEMDRSQWWNTRGMLSSLGKLAVERGLPKTHLFARARAVFAVASHRCDEVYNPANSYTLWRLPAEIEDQAENAYADIVNNLNEWDLFIEKVNASSSLPLLEALLSLELISTDVAEQATRLRRSNDLRSVSIANVESIDSSTVAVMAAAFSRSERGKLAVPYVCLEGTTA